MFSHQPTTPRAVETPKLVSPQTETAPVNHSVPIESTTETITETTTVNKTEEQVNNTNSGDLITIETTTTETTVQQNMAEPQKIVESVTVIETNEIKIEPEIVVNGDGPMVDTNKLNEPESNEMTGK